MKIKLLSLVIFFNFICFYGQNINYSTLLITDNLKENANSIVLNQQIEIVISAQNNYTITTKKALVIFNELGLKNIDAREYYDKSSKIKSIEAVIYDSFGKEIKKIKRKDFKDQSVADGFSIFTDDRIIFLDYTPIQYPFIIVYESEKQSSNTAFIPSWYPEDDINESILKSSITIKYPSDLGFKYKEVNFNNREIKKIQNTNELSFSVENLTAMKNEEYSPSFIKLAPHVLFGLEKFSLEGVEGTAKSWKDFGLWRYNTMLADNETISEETSRKIKQLVGNETDPIKKAKIIYKYVQDKTRYVSVQLGIGGWKPMQAQEVDRLGYGDCKALTNYTRVLLKAVNVESFYTVIYGNRNKVDFETDFVSMQGNHIVLAIPVNEKLCFLECTSQISPFGFEGDFTDDRFALLLKPDGGEIVRTNNYDEKSNLQLIKGNYVLDQQGSIECGLTIQTKGIQYDNRYHLENETTENINKYYKSIFGNINIIKVDKPEFMHHREDLTFEEKLKFSATNFGAINGNQIMFPLNVFNQYSHVPQRYRTRNNPFEIERGFYDKDEIEITIPENYAVESKPENFQLKDKFGEYKFEIQIIGQNKINYKREIFIYKGYYEKTEYENFRKFREQIAKADNSKIVIVKK